MELRRCCETRDYARLQRLFMSKHTASEMSWHKEKRMDTKSVLRHPTDSNTWKEFDKQYPVSAQDPRNVRLGLATDGFNHFGTMSNSYSIWPVILVPYNLPPWKCMKSSFFIMSLLISGPQAPGKIIDVYLQPLIDELKELWNDGVDTYDVSTGQGFRLNACILWTINDVSPYGNLSGWSTKGYKACPVCNGETSPNQFAPKLLSGFGILKQLEHVRHVTFGKNPNNVDRKRKCTSIELNWTKKSITFELEYWANLKIRHNIDVMHIEKNVYDNVLGTLLNLEGKTKDTIKALMDLENMNIRPELHLQDVGTKYLKPSACYTFTTEERQKICQFIKSVKFPDGYASNISRNVNV
ncbi:hypothetical protein Dsin_019753 [Dipteronia sinensis]|uniref:Uncharacterized protein n=1 Tax=Dipteronia sinensis TaxID=43782 RepID=A0AAE0E2U3_9ROSI|nr:hypothetical protein Dsin_019753 [Dipteronia sinensis]